MKKLLALALLVAPIVGWAAYKTPAETEFLLNKGYGRETQLGTQLAKKKVHTLQAQYDYSVVGGSSGSITLKDLDGKDNVVPDNAIIKDCIIDVITAPTSSAFPTLAFSTGQTEGDIKAAAAIATYSGLMTCIPIGTATRSIKMTADRAITMSITTTSTTATHSLTAGKINVYIDYILGE